MNEWIKDIGLAILLACAFGMVVAYIVLDVQEQQSKRIIQLEKELKQCRTSNL